nr:hypothetical protein OG781_38655 [Streptomyces sp. NBC_00830]
MDDVYHQQTKNLLGTTHMRLSKAAWHHEIPDKLPHPRSQQTV